MINAQELLKRASAILPTLPVSHYLRVSSIPVTLSTTEPTSFFDPVNFAIVLSFSNFLDNAKKTKPIDDASTEKIVRCFLYHELSHAIMTPTILMQYLHIFKRGYHISDPNFDTDVINIIEDERIESVLRSYYYGVDFRWNLESTCPLNKEDSRKSLKGFIFNAMRHRYSPIDEEEINERINAFVKETKTFSSTTCGSKIQIFMIKIYCLYDFLRCEFSKLSNKSNAQPNGRENQNQGSDQNGNENANGNANANEGGNNQESHSGNNESKERKPEDDGTKESNNGQCNHHGKNQGESEKRYGGNSAQDSNEDKQENQEEALTKEEAEQAVAQIVVSLKKSADNHGSRTMKLNDYEGDKKARIDIMKVIARKCGFGTTTAPVIYGTHGKFSAGHYLADYKDERKWFKKTAFENTGIEAKKGEKKTLNLWLDNSGSFRDNDDATNAILRTLEDIEKERDDFKFNLVRVQYGMELMNGENRVSNSDGGTTFTQAQAKNLYKELNKTGREVNIVLFDGEIFCDMQSYTALAPFNNNKCIFIVEKDNTPWIKQVCKDARSIIEENVDYTKQLEKHIATAIDMLF